MSTDHALPNYEQLFGEVDIRPADETRSVYSPAAYLADLLQLTDEIAATGEPGQALRRRRPDLDDVPLDGRDTYTEIPYLDIVNDVLGNELTGRTEPVDGATPDETDVEALRMLATLRYPFVAPFSFGRERVRRYLARLGVEPVELYRQFATEVDADVVAREYLGLSPADADIIVTELADGQALRECYHLGTAADAWTTLADAARFRHATGLTAAELRELLAGPYSQAGAAITLDAAEHHLVGTPAPAWFDRVNRFVRLARRSGLTFTELDLVVRTCCAGQINAAALRAVAVVIWLRRAYDLPLDVIVSLVAPMPVLDAGDEDKDEDEDDLFNRVFNLPFPGDPILLGPGRLPTGWAKLPVLRCAGDMLATANTAYRRRVATAVGLTERDLAAVVTRVRDRATGTAPGLFEGPEPGLAELSLLHRAGRLTAALGVSVDELFALLDALGADPSVRRFNPLPILLDTGGTATDLDAVLAGADVPAGLWLMQQLYALTRWLSDAGLDARDLCLILGVPTGPSGGDEDAAVLESLRERFDALGVTAETFRSVRFGDRAAQVVADVVTSAAPEGALGVVRLDPAQVAPTAHGALEELAIVADGDLTGIGLGDRLAAKILANLGWGGYLGAGAVILPERLPADAADLRLAGTFEAYRDVLFKMIATICEGPGMLPVPGEDEEPAAGDPSWYFPSDLGMLTGLSDTERAELYDNLVFHGYLDASGQIADPGFFRAPGNLAEFSVDVDLGGLASEVHALLAGRVAAFAGDAPPFDPALFDDLPLSVQQRTTLVDSLRFNGHVDAEDRWAGPAGLLERAADEFGLAVELLAYRRPIVDAVKAALAARRTELYRMEADDFVELADAVTARRVLDRLDGVYLDDGWLIAAAAAFLADPAGADDPAGFAGADGVLMLDGFTAAECAVITSRLREVLTDAAPYRVDPAALTTLGFPGDKRDQLMAYLVEAAFLTPAYAIAPARVEYFASVYNAADFRLAGLEDFTTDVFVLLHRVAVATRDAVAEIGASLARVVAGQRAAAVEVLGDAFGAPAATVGAIAAALAGGHEQVLDLIVGPALDSDGSDPDLRRALRRIRGFARLAQRLDLDPAEVDAAFIDQDLTGKFPEPLLLPTGVDSVDALLESADGNVYLFHADNVWQYRDGRLLDAESRSLADLSPALGSLSTVDAAFRDGTGTEWIVGRDDQAAPRSFAREPGRTRWAPSTQEWGVVTNAFDDAPRIDAAFVDDAGRTYLFRGEQYVRYSGTNLTTVDEGYPRRIGQWWENERRTTPLPARFRESLDAAFHGRDDVTYLFAGDKFLAVRGDAVGESVTGEWGRIANALHGADRVDAAYAAGDALLVFAGNQVFRYSASIEAPGVRVDDAYPRTIETHYGDVPVEFEGGVEAAFADVDKVVHLFKNGKTAALSPGNEVVPTPQRWGRLGTVLPGGRVEAAFTGLDGRTYLFSDDRYVRYSTADYSTVDVGWPRAIAGDWGGLRRVDAAFVLDGATYLFGAAGELCTLSFEGCEAELAAGRAPRAVRRALRAYEITVADTALVFGVSPDDWRLNAEGQIGLLLCRVEVKVGERTERRLVVRCTEDTTVPFHVRYATRDYTTPDAGFPRPVTGNWWNLPDDLVAPGAAFATVDAVLTARDGLTYLFSGPQFVVFDSKRRWWSEPRALDEHWDSLPFTHLDAAFVGADGKTYVFSDTSYARYSGVGFTRVDDRYPASITPFWGNVANNIARTGRVDAALVLPDPDKAGTTYTYLFSGDQFVRYTHVLTDAERPYYEAGLATEPGVVDLGYPRKLSALSGEPRLGALTADLDGVDAAFADRGTVYLLRGRRIHSVSATPYRRYDAVVPAVVGCVLVEDGAPHVEQPDGWHRVSAIEGATVSTPESRPRVLRDVPVSWRTGLDAVLAGTDGNTYLFQGTSCFGVDVGHEFPLAEELGRPRNAFYHDDRVDAAFVGTDGRTYVFSGEQFVAYQGKAYDGLLDEEPRPIAEHWGGLSRVVLAYVREGTTYVFGAAEADGTMPYVVYSGHDYTTPDAGYPRTTGAGFWGLPDRYRPAGFTAPTAVLTSGDSLLFVVGGNYVQHHETAGTWSYPRPLERLWRGLGGIGKDTVEGLVTAFTGADEATYFFFADGFVRHHGGVAEPRRRVREQWGRTTNPFLTGSGSDIVDAAVVVRGVTYLFSGERYVRYSGSDYRYVDAGYPKPIVAGLRTEDGFGGLPATFDDDLAERFAAGRVMIDGAFADERHVYLFVDRTCHVVSHELAGTYDLGILGSVRNVIAERGRVDAALVTPSATLLFSGDQYVRYSSAVGDHTVADEGYPRTIGGWLPQELGLAPGALPFRDTIDAALCTGDNRVILFAGEQFATIAAGTVSVAPVRGAWGVVRNGFRLPGAGLDAAFVAPAGELYAFAGDQYVRYAAGKPEKVDDGYPRLIRDAWGDLPTLFEDRLDTAFTLDGRVYLGLGAEYVRYGNGHFDAVDRTYPQQYRHRWSATADYRLADLHTITRVVALARTHPDPDGGLTTFLAPGPRVVAEPYRYLADLFGWDVDEVAWCRRNSRFLSGAAADEERVEWEFLLELSDLFAVTRRLGIGPSRVVADVFDRLHPDAGRPEEAAIDAAADALLDLLSRVTDAQSRTETHNELNAILRDALLAAVLARAGADTTARDLFDRLLVDVEMGGRGVTSRVREAIAAAQLYLHRYLLNLEALPPVDENADPVVAEAAVVAAEATRERVRTWWPWTRSYRIWEAHRKVFLYPENYLRPELRAAKTPAFTGLESDLLQGEITADTVERAYKRYLDEYTEVSRLTIAGGYVYTKDRNPNGARRLVLFGRTRTDPRRYYYRLAEFATRDKLAASWEAWQPVGVQIDADHVHPVHAFGRVFVFWVVTEPVRDASTSTTVVARDATGGGQAVSSPPGQQRVRLMYSFYNLTKDWVPAQILGHGIAETGTIGDATLLVQPRLAADGERMTVVVACNYTVTVPSEDPAKPATTRPGSALFELNPELYAVDLSSATDANAVAVALDVDAAQASAATTERVGRVFVDPVEPGAAVRFDAPTRSEIWFSVDHQGGSVLCRPIVVEPETLPVPATPLKKDRLPVWSRVDAAVELPGGTRYFFDNTNHTFAEAPGPKGTVGDPIGIAKRFGWPATVLPDDGKVDAVLVRANETIVVSGGQYVRFRATPFERFDADYPLPLTNNPDRLPSWDHIDVAFVGADDIEYFINGDQFTTSEDLTSTKSLREHWVRKVVPDAVWTTLMATFRAVVVTDSRTYLVWQDQYLRFEHPKTDPPKGKTKKDLEPYAKPDGGLRFLSGNGDGLPAKVPAGTRLAWRKNVLYAFDNTARTYTATTGGTTGKPRPIGAGSSIARDRIVDGAWMSGRSLYLAGGNEYVRYTLPEGSDVVPALIDEGYPKPFPGPVDAILHRGDDLFLFTKERYAFVNATVEPFVAPADRSVYDGWAGLPRTTGVPFDAAMRTGSELILFTGNTISRYAQTGTVPRPYEMAGLPFELIRLTTGTASTLNQKLLSGGVPALLDLSTQETDEAALSTEATATGAIRVRKSMVAEGKLPTGSHLDFRSANGIYYQEIFFHAPLLIAQALNAAQRFEDAKRWYEYVFDPTHPSSYWRYLPFLAIDLAALADSVEADLSRLRNLRPAPAEVRTALAKTLTALRTYAPAAQQGRAPATPAEQEAFDTLTSTAEHLKITGAVDALAARTDLTAAQRARVTTVRERALMIVDVERQLDRLGDRDGLLKAYQEDPFNPYAIADLRPVAHRRAVVMAYVDNLLDWGDLLFRQYTPESVDEARMLYLFAYDLLGAPPERLATALPSAAETFEEIGPDLVGQLTSGGTLVDGAGVVHAGVTSSYFHIPDNEVFEAYWIRVLDRLTKIRQSLNILGISQPLPLFAPPIDPMALVRSAAAGELLDGLTAPVEIPVPQHRFSTLLRRAQDLADKLRSLGTDLVSALERGNAEELSLLQGRQEKEILTLTRAIKQAQVTSAEQTLAELTASQQEATARAAHYDTLIATGMSALERGQADSMATGADLNLAAGIIKIAASIAHVVPEFYLGPFIVGTKTGGRSLGATLDNVAGATESMGEAYSMKGELMGVQAQFERMSQDWTQQLATARSDIEQITHRIAGANAQLVSARQDAEILERQLAHNDAIGVFMRDKFSNAQLYHWMADGLGALYFQAYHLAYDTARAAERALQFEAGISETFVRPSYWDSRRNGLLAAETLSLDLDRLAAAQAGLGGLGGRGLEVTRQVSLRELDPVALVRFRTAGTCEFALTEALFDEDFPGHFRRQIRTVTVTFTDGEGNPATVNATLTQLGHKTVLSADPQAVRFLLDPQGAMPATVRGEWRAGEKIALSQPDGGRENNGLFELRFDDERLLPFEGTGAVSTWRLQRAGRLPATLSDVVIVVKYTAEDGGELFANAVKGMRRPHPAARFFDLARDFSQEWADFLANGDRELVLPFSADMFPDLVGRRITGIYPTYELANGASSRLLLGGDPAMALTESRLLTTPGLALRGTPWSFTVEGPKENVRNVGLVLTYQAREQ
ncbi:hypothetical protein HH310_19715 [Actinoplanes sp. TBRC 11911]|uniref:Tc toxin subunit A-related protein n=1 Tax=Actinoplanes sp. TBRC 11911 TaxID=2729386 RepID=UPI00145FA4C8|nr:hemopexin repeat-containing protein [Actinoplanes sp. TBRC 11911]NMO53404.1 hypothetical protein [Actinoplanes sp. TBRC 11911]